MPLKTRELLVVKFWTIIHNQHFSNTTASELHLDLRVLAASKKLVWLKLFAGLFRAVFLVDCTTRKSFWFQHSFVANRLFTEHGENILQYQFSCCGADLTFPYKDKGTLQSCSLDLATLSTRLACYNMAEQQGGNSIVLPALLDDPDLLLDINIFSNPL